MWSVREIVTHKIPFNNQFNPNPNPTPRAGNTPSVSPSAAMNLRVERMNHVLAYPKHLRMTESLCGINKLISAALVCLSI